MTWQSKASKKKKHNMINHRQTVAMSVLCLPTSKILLLDSVVPGK